MDIYYWQDKGKDWFALNGDTDDFFMDVVDHEIQTFDHEQSMDWIQFWVSPQSAQLLCRLYPVQYDKPITDLAQFKYESEQQFDATQQQMEKEFDQNWKEVKPLDNRLKEDILDLGNNRKFDAKFRETWGNVNWHPEDFEKPSTTDDESNKTETFVYREEDFE